MTEGQLYPKDPKPTWDKSGRKWRVKYNLIYDGGFDRWSGYYRTKIGARIAAWYNYHIASYGGSAELIYNKGK